MEKKKYVKPSMEVYVLNQPSKLLVGSGGGGDFNYIPTIPGQPQDDKHLT
jgi:hypothetical protein